MAIDITIPSPGESVTEVVLGRWQKRSGEWVDRDEPLVEIESDKVTLEVPAPAAGLLTIEHEEGTELTVGDRIGSIDPEAARPAGRDGEAGARPDEVEAAAANEVATATAAAPVPATGARATSVARKMAEDRGVDLARVPGTGPSGRVTKSDVLAAATPAAPAPPAPAPAAAPIEVRGERGVRRERMSPLRRRIAERLVQAQRTAAMLTTFNEADMSEVMRLRREHKERFAEQHGVGLGFMSFFVKACASALQRFPRVNAYIVDDEIEYHDFVDISVAVGTDKGLVVPVLRSVETMSFAGVEATIKDFAIRARDGQLALDEMTGGTFTISNGGVYGSLNSTPILNPPQSGILGMHRIMNRAIEDPAAPGQIVLRPMMYLALSYDHRIVDGAEAVGFLVHVKECVEKPERLLFGV
ncbi:MAG: 2-oxoglutarate dehydrogenase complex dihydrolipoyllysine-residue succinyltransferase [Planctomycetota bacterium]|jgi:2-oxoglutarate dehydrogenase E2 component (dihydrolipoamide succinyltransferase)